jgi:4-hydroxy-2-oxoheptanedioate aldolase
MDLPVNSFKHALQAGKPQIGIWSFLSSAIVSEILSNSAFDWVLIDTEHAPNELPMVQQQLHAMQGGLASPVVRVAWNDRVMIKRVLDIGAQTLLLPYIQSVEEATDAVVSMRYPPEGLRGVAGLTRAAGYGRIKDYIRNAASELCLLVQVESRKGMANIDAIAAVEGVDGVFIGPSDLSTDMGHFGNWRHPEVWNAIESAAVIIRKAGKAPGILVAESDAQRCLDMGYLFVAIASDIGLLRAGDAIAAKFKPKTQ